MDNNYCLKLACEDHENVNENKSIKSMFLNNEDLIYSNKIIKIKKKPEDRIIVITSKYIYNLKGKKYRSKIDIRNIIGITFSRTSDEFVLHIYESEYDFHYESKHRTLILELIARIYYYSERKKIKFGIVDDKLLLNYVTSKSDKKLDKGKTKFNDSSQMDVDHYLYGNLEKTVSKTLASVTKVLKSEIVFYNPNTCGDLDLKKLRIENFRHLEVLSLSVYGEVVLAEYIPTGVIYFIRTINSSDTNEFCLTFDILMDINLSKDFPFMARLDILLKTQTVTYLISKFKDNFEGGYLISKVYDMGIFCESTALFFGSQIALIIDYFHKKKIKFLGFSPQNFLIGPDGYIRFVDYEMDYNTVKKHADKICIFNGPEEYKMIENDWYNFGVIMYEMLFGIPPSLNNGVPSFQEYYTVSEKAKKFLETIFKPEVYETFNIDKLKETELFKDTNFDDILKKKINIGLRFLGEEDDIPMMPGMDEDKKPKEKCYNILNFNSIDLDVVENY